RLKTDKRDARALGSVSCKIDLPSVHIPSKRSRELNSLCGMREALVGARTAVVNTIKGFVRGQVFSVRLKADPHSLPKGTRLLFQKEGTPIPPFLARQLEALESLNELVKAADKELAGIAKKDKDCRRLMTVPGVGPVTAVRFVAAVDKVERFESAHRLES